MQRRTAKNKALVADEVALGRYLFNARGMRSEVSGCELGFDYNHIYCSHLLTKAAYPKFRLYPKNMVFKTPDEHRMWENASHKLKHLPEWEWVFKLHELLKQEYYQRGNFFITMGSVLNTRSQIIIHHNN
jgi:hypothetical protein